MTTRSLSLLKKAILSLAVITSLAAIMPTEAQADPRHRGRHWHNDWRERQRRAHYWRHTYPSYGYVYAPPPVVYYPPAPSPGINFFIPLNIR